MRKRTFGGRILFNLGCIVEGGFKVVGEPKIVPGAESL